MSKTTCCGLRYIGENHNPIRPDGYCMNCGFHPKVKELEEKLEKLKKAVIEVYANINSWDLPSKREIELEERLAIVADKRLAEAVKYAERCDEVIDLKKKLAIAVDALKFYANEDSWEVNYWDNDEDEGDTVYITTIGQGDFAPRANGYIGGLRARTVLKEIEEIGEIE